MFRNAVASNYFDAMQLRILRGRACTDDEARAGANVVVISASTSRRLWPNQEPLGRRLRPRTWGTTGRGHRRCPGRAGAIGRRGSVVLLSTVERLDCHDAAGARFRRSWTGQGSRASGRALARSKSADRDELIQSGFFTPRELLPETAYDKWRAHQHPRCAVDAR
jgi:hypothetical protein